jgi:hypothetical protein
MRIGYFDYAGSIFASSFKSSEWFPNREHEKGAFALPKQNRQIKNFTKLTQRQGIGKNPSFFKDRPCTDYTFVAVDINAACAAASRATGTRKGEQET